MAVTPRHARDDSREIDLCPARPHPPSNTPSRRKCFKPEIGSVPGRARVRTLNPEALPQSRPNTIPDAPRSEEVKT